MRHAGTARPITVIKMPATNGSKAVTHRFKLLAACGETTRQISIMTKGNSKIAVGHSQGNNPMSKPAPNIDHICSLAALWGKREISQQEEIVASNTKASTRPPR